MVPSFFNPTLNAIAEQNFPATYFFYSPVSNESRICQQILHYFFSTANGRFF